MIPLLSRCEVPDFRGLCFIGDLGAEGAQIMALLQLRGGRKSRKSTTSEPQWVTVCHGSAYTCSGEEAARVCVFHKAIF